MEYHDLKELKKYLTAIEPLKALARLGEQFSSDIFIVGGLIRDFFLKRITDKKSIEIDFALDKDIEALTANFAQRIKGNLIVLDEKTRSYRIILKKDKNYQFDFNKFRANSIEEDLSLRDFTMNALALNLKEIVEGECGGIIDSCRGIKDIDNKLIRAASRHSFKDDPLRIIRAFSFRAKLGFDIETDTLNLINEQKHLISETAGERIAEELSRILINPHAHTLMCQMDALGVLDEIFPTIKEMKDTQQGPYHHLDIWRHSLLTFEELENVLEELSSNPRLSDKIKVYLEKQLGGARTRVFTLKLAALFHDIGKPRAKEITPEGKVRFIGHERIGLGPAAEISERLKLSLREKDSLLRLIELHLRPGNLVDTQDISAKAKFRFFRIAQEDSIAVVLLALADKRATRGPLTTQESQVIFREYLIKLMEDYFYREELVKPIRLLDGNEIMQILKIPPGPAVGEILKALEEAHVDKKIDNKKEAEEFVKTIFRTEIKNTGLAQTGIRAYFHSIVTDKDSSLRAIPIKFFLSLLSLIYLLLIKIVVFLYANNIVRKTRLSVKVISVGNLTWGGTGKTPLVKLIARYLKDNGRVAAIISRGYGKIANCELQIANCKIMGDEAFMLSRNLKDIPVIVNPDRISAADEAVKKYNADTVILDDGFQQWKITKDIDIVTIDAAHPFGNGWLLPRGILREPITCLKRADIFILNKINLTQNKNKLNKLKLILKEINPRALIVESVYEPKNLKNLISGEEIELNFLKGKDICVLSGIASPDSFKATVEKLQCNIKLNFEFLDHYSYRKEDLYKIFNTCDKNGIKILVTTEKDAVRLESLFKEYAGDIKLFYLAVETDISGQKEAFYGRLSSIY